MKKKSSGRRIDVNVEELDRILDGATQTLMTKSDCQKVKAAGHAMARKVETEKEHGEDQHRDRKASSSAEAEY